MGKIRLPRNRQTIDFESHSLKNKAISSFVCSYMLNRLLWLDKSSYLQKPTIFCLPGYDRKTVFSKRITFTFANPRPPFVCNRLSHCISCCSASPIKNPLSKCHNQSSPVLLGRKLYFWKLTYLAYSLFFR